MQNTILSHKIDIISIPQSAILDHVAKNTILLYYLILLLFKSNAATKMKAKKIIFNSLISI